jgi:serine/threonine protein phosphatase PrpC
MQPVIRYATGHASLKGRFHPNEDRVSIQVSDSECLVVLCDGHDGSACAAFVQRLLPRELAGPCSKPGSPGSASAGGVVESAWTSHVKSTRVFNARAAGSTSGACVTTVMIRNLEVVAANVGDARAVLRRPSGELVVLTEDHRVSNGAERARIVRLGGTIRNNRVLGVLEPTRTIGDLCEKERAGHPDVISAVPSTCAANLDLAEVLSASTPGTSLSCAKEGVQAVGARDFRKMTAASKAAHSSARVKSVLGPVVMRSAAMQAPREAALLAAQIAPPCLIVASDGVWDVLSTPAAVDIVVRALLLHRGDATAAARELVLSAQRAGSVDDITAAVVVWTMEGGACVPEPTGVAVRSEAGV